MSKFFWMIPSPPTLQAQSRVYDLKARLDWGEPALTIIDVSDSEAPTWSVRSQFNISHIMGAIPMPMNELVDRALTNVELTRDIYIYGETDDETAVGAAKLRASGYQKVSEIRGGVAAWKAVGYPVETILSVLAVNES